MAEKKVKASELKVGDKIKLEVRGQTMEVELNHVAEDELKGNPIIELRFETPDQDGWLTRNVPPDEEITKVG